jgi:cyclomaltodextrinase / maltogenic alpha-amylase / neopullulanase
MAIPIGTPQSNMPQGIPTLRHWCSQAVFYHIYPLGCFGAPLHNDFTATPRPRLTQLLNWIPHLHSLGVNSLYLGPVFESAAHGYDTADFFTVDRRLGFNHTLADCITALHDQGIRVILDGVFHHVGRDFWAFRDVLAQKEQSPYCAWFEGLDFNGRSPLDDPFTYTGWKGHYDLVKLNLNHPPVRQHLFKAVETWIHSWHIDGLRLDAADCIDKPFLRALATHCRTLSPDFWLMGEVVAGDYRDWVQGELLDSVTNYMCYKGLYSSHVDRNYFEIAYSLNRLFGKDGICRDQLLYNFADNHDVDRVASRLNNPAHLYPLYCLLFTIPGIPSIYYGSEWGLEGRRTKECDTPLRPAIDLDILSQQAPHPDLAQVIARLAAIRSCSSALQRGNYEPLHVGHQQLAFARQLGNETVIVALNAAELSTEFTLELPLLCDGPLIDLLNPGESLAADNNRCTMTIPPTWARILAPA